MAVKAKGLGRGLDAMIPKNQEIKEKPAPVKPEKETDEKGVMVKTSLIEPNRNQPRKTFNEDSLEELADSIKQFGIINPLIVQDRKDHYEIIGGERRWRAAMSLGLKEVPVIIKNYSEEELAEIALIDNIQREELNPIEEAQAYKRLIDELKIKQDDVAKKVSKSRSTVTNSMRLLKLCEEVQQMIIDSKITTGHARALLSVEDPQKQLEIAERIFDEKLSVREVEKLVKNIDKPAKEKTAKDVNKELELFYRDISEKLKEAMGTKVSISGKGDGTGKIEIEFYSNDELDRLVSKLK